jgi:multidrug efflux pump subunit AcrA (membrane-fusion protein)
MALFEGLVRGAGFIVTGELVPTMDSASARLAGQQARKEAEQNRARLRAQNALTKAEKRTAIEKLNNEKKITSEKKKQNTESKIIDEINKRFEMDRIQIAAALGGQINDVERLRLELMQAILDEDVKRAIILEGQLIKAEAAAAELALLLDSLDEMVGDPFADWPGTITRIQELLKTLKIKIPIETLFAEKGLKLDQEKMTVTKLERMDVNATNVYINGARPLDEFKNPFKVGTLEHAIEEGKKADLAESDAAALLAESEALLALIESERALAEAENAIKEAALASLFAKLGLDAEGNPITTTTINVNVEGNVISAEDLAETITDIQYTYQKTGKGLLFSSIAI